MSEDENSDEKSEASVSFDRSVDKEEEEEEAEENSGVSRSETELSAVEEKSETESQESAKPKRQAKKPEKEARPSLSLVVGEINQFSLSLAGVISSFSNSSLHPRPLACPSLSGGHFGSQTIQEWSQSHYKDGAQKRDMQLQVSVPRHCDEAIRAVQEYKEKLRQKMGLYSPAEEGFGMGEKVLHPSSGRHKEAQFGSEATRNSFKKESVCAHCSASLGRIQNGQIQISKYSRQTPENQSMRVERAMMRLRGELN